MLTEKEKKRKTEIFEEIIEKRGKSNPLTKSQRRHLNRVAKKRVKKEERIEKQLKQQRESGKLIEENHNDKDYSPEFTDKSASWYINELKNHMNDSSNLFLDFFRSKRENYINLLLKWNQNYPRDNRFYFIKGLIEIYWNNKSIGDEIQKYTKSYLGNRNQGDF